MLLADYGSDDIICHLSATNAKGHVVVAAGDKISLQWTTWPDSHHGPVITYLADSISFVFHGAQKTKRDQ